MQYQVIGRAISFWAWEFCNRNVGGAHNAVHHAVALAANESHGTEARIKNGPALAGHGAEALYQAITRTITTLPEQLKRSLTWDQGAEMASTPA